MIKSKYSVFIYQEVMRHYRVANFKMLNDVLNGELLVFYDHSPKSSSDQLNFKEERFFKCDNLKSFSFFNGKIYFQNIFRPLIKWGIPNVIIAQGTSRFVSNYFLILLKILGVKIIFWGHGHSMKSERKGAKFRDFSQILLMKMADAYVTYSGEGASFVKRYCNAKKVFTAPNTIDVERILAIKKSLPDTSRLKEALHLPLKHYAIFIGKLIPVKKVEVVIDKIVMLNKRGIAIGGVIIGEGKERDKLVNRVPLEFKDRIRFLGKITDLDETSPYMYLSDFYMSPGGIGLALNQCLSLGVPVIAESNSARAAHGPEIAYLTSGENGFLVDFENDDELTRIVHHILDNREEFRKKCINYAENNLSINNFVEGFISALSYLDIPIKKGGYWQMDSL